MRGRVVDGDAVAGGGGAAHTHTHRHALHVSGIAGVADHFAQNDAHALEITRGIISNLPFPHTQSATAIEEPVCCMASMRNFVLASQTDAH